MEQQKQLILLKITGEIFINRQDKTMTSTHLANLAQQIAQLKDTHQFGIVMGGGNFFRGASSHPKLKINKATGHQIGMLATMMNGLIVQDILTQHGHATTLVCALPAEGIGTYVSQEAITTALNAGHILIFTGGIGTPFFTTDTAAVVRALQMNAHQIWKGTTINGVYSDDPAKNPQAYLIKHLTMQDAIEKKLGIMDTTAYVLAQEHKQSIRIFNIFAENALVHAAHNPQFGSCIA
jgi:uridylate kinase